MSDHQRAILNKLAQKKKKAIGNSNRTLLSVTQDMLLAHGRDNSKKIALACFMSPATVERVMDCDANNGYETYKPRAETLEKIMRYCNCEVSVDYVAIKKGFQNHARDD